MVNQFLRNHFTTEIWKHGEVRWTFHILPDNKVRRMVGRYAKNLYCSGLFPPIPPKWLHMTILQLGSVKDIQESEIEEVIRTLRPICASMKMPELTAGPQWIWDSSPQLQITPEPPLLQIFNATMKSVKEVLGNRAPKHPQAFIPHITMAYSSDYYKRDEINKHLAKRPIHPVAFRATNLSLVKQIQTLPFYQWELFDNISLGQ